MKLTTQQLEQQLTKSLAPIYLLSSDEILLVQDNCDLIREKAIANGYSDFIKITCDTHTAIEEHLFTAAQSLSLFATKKLIEFNFHHFKFGAAQGKFFQSYAEKPAPDVIIVIRTNKIDAKSEKSAWFQAFLKHITFVAIWPVTGAQLPQWTLQRANKMGLTLSRENAELIAQQAEGNLLAMQQELEKLFLYQLSPPEKNSKLSQTLTDNARFTVFDLVESMAASNHTRSLRILKNLNEEDVEPTLILWALAREIRTLTEMSYAIKNGSSIAALFNQFHIYEKRQNTVRSFLQRVSLEKCHELLLKAAKIDRIIKGAATGNVWNEMERVVLQI